MLEIRGLTKEIPGGRRLLDDVTLRLDRGEFAGILGASGAGKTLTIRSIVRLTEFQGEVRFQGRDGAARQMEKLRGRELRQARREIGVIFQGLQLVKQLTVIENVMMGRLGSISPLRSWLYGFTSREAAEAMAVLARVEMADFAGRVTGSLSGGEMQRVAIARAIFQRPAIYLADEPIASLDPKNGEAIMRLLRSLSEEAPVLGTFHQPSMTRRYCSRVIGLKSGRVVYDGGPNLDQEQLRHLYGAELEAIEGAAVRELAS
jgi:phosphonate transport system ATP-binding protein